MRAVPELCRFYNIVIKMLYNDNVQHHKPHFHVYFAEYEASVGVDGELLAGSIPVKQLKLVQAWAAIHEEEQYIAWKQAVQNAPFCKADQTVFHGVYINHGVTVWNDGDTDLSPKIPI